MSDTMITTKLHKPILPLSLVVKDEILQRLSAVKVSIICAQAGAGKSTAVSYWLDRQPNQFLWYSLDDWDNDFNLFLSYLGEGLLPIDEVVAHQLLQLIRSNNTLSEEGLIKTVVSLLHTVDVEFVFVLDDYHVIIEQRIHKLLGMLLTHLPPGLHLCLISREDPPLPIAKIRSQHQIYELRMASLKFTLEEAEGLFFAALPNRLNNDQIAHLYHRSEGWVAGLQLMAMSLQGMDDVDEFIGAFTGNHYYIMDYLMEEVLERHDPEIRHFLLKSSILSYFTPQMCEYVLEMSPSETLVHIDYLVRTNSFLIPLNIQRQWYRYHHLFRELLKQQLQRYVGIDIQRLYQRAGEWFLAQEEYLEAIDHFLQGGCIEDAMAVIEKRWAPMDMELRSSSWLDMAKRLPLNQIETSPVLCLGYGWSLLDRGDIIGCNPWFERAEELYNSWHTDDPPAFIRIYDQDSFNSLPVKVLSGKAFIAAIEGRYESLMYLTDELSQLAVKHKDNRQWVTDSLIAMMHWGQGNLNEALAVMRKVKEDTQGNLSTLIQSTFTWVMIEIYIQKGEITKAQVLINNAIEEVSKEKIAPVMVATYYLLSAIIESIRGNRDQAYDLLERSKSYGYRYEFMDWRYKYLTHLSRLYLQDQLYDKAKECIDEGSQHPYLNPAPETLTIEDMSLWVALQTEKDDKRKRYYIDEALDEMKRAGVDLPPYTQEMRWKIILSIAPVDGYYNMLEFLSEGLLDRARDQERHLHVIEYTLLARRFTKSQSKKESLFLTAKNLAEKEGIVQPFYEFCESELMPMVKGKDSFEVKREYVNQSLPEPLTARELELLSLIAKGYSNQEISAMLFIALSTVKSYNHSLFGKLDVKRRTEAVAKAIELGLIQ